MPSEPVITTPLVIVGLVLAVTFFVQLLSVHWRSTPAGKSTMLLSFVIVVATGLATARYLGVELAEWVRPALWVLIDIALLGRVIAFARSYSEGRRERRTREQETSATITP